jgi:opacity protein-like surface antigen
MRKRTCAAVVLALTLASSLTAADATKPWRVGASYAHLTSQTATDALGSAWAAGVEYSFSDALTEDEALPGDVSISVYYRIFDQTSAGVDRSVNYTSASLKWRGGAGANPGSEGLYAGIGIGAALMSIKPSLDAPGPHESMTKFEWSAFAGANYARWFFAEVGYSNAGTVGGMGFGMVTFTFGARL